MRDRLRRSDTCNNILALCVHQIFAIKLLFACGGVSGESNACAAIVTHIAEYHCLYVDSGTPACRNIIHAAVYDRSWVIPRTEYCRYCFKKLFLCVLRKLFAHFTLIDLFIFFNDFFQIVRIQLSIHLHAFCVFCSLNAVLRTIPYRCT